MHRIIKGKDGISKETWPLEARTISSKKTLRMENVDHRNNRPKDYWKYCFEFNLSGSKFPVACDGLRHGSEGAVT